MIKKTSYVSEFYKKGQALGYILLLVLTLMGLLSFARAIHYTFFTPAGGVDFHSYWYAGLFIRQKSDPYAAYVLGQTPELPILYINGPTDKVLPIDSQLAITPANTAPIVLLLSLFAWLTWPLAKLLWFLINCVFAFLIPGLVMRLFPRSGNLAWFDFCLLYSAFFALKGIRGALSTGQTTLLVFVLLLFCLLRWDTQPTLAGVMLGIALSKYSVALPLFLYGLYKRQFKVIISAILVQIAGILFISVLTRSSPYSIVENYYLIMCAHADMPGIQLAELFNQGILMRSIAPILLTVFCSVFFIWLLWRKPQGRPSPAQRQFYDLHLLTALTLWTLLVAYHRSYDGVLIILFIGLLVYGLNQPMDWRLSSSQQKSLALFLSIAVAIFIIPYEKEGLLMSSAWGNILGEIIAKSVIMTLVMMLLINLWLLQRIHQQATVGQKMVDAAN